MVLNATFAIYAAGVSQKGGDTIQTHPQEVKPIPKPRKFQRCLQERYGSPEPVRVPVQETSDPAQTFTSYLNRADVVYEDRQQGTPLVDRRGKPRRQAISVLKGTEGSHSKSAPVSPLLKRHAGQHASHFKPG